MVWLVLIAAGAIAGLTFLDAAADRSSTDVLQEPSGAHLLGTDEQGRDVLTRVLAGAAVSLQVAVVSVLIGLVLGGAVGMLAAVSRRLADEAMMRTVDVFLAFPAIVLALLVSLVLGTKLLYVSLIIGVVIAPQVARIIRARLRLELREGYVDAERSTGAPLRRILAYHVSRNVAPPIAAYCLLLLADAMLFEAALSYIGVGIQPPQASWGNMILDGQRVLLSGSWWVSVFPGAFLFLTVAALNVIAGRRVGVGDEQLVRA